MTIFFIIGIAIAAACATRVCKKIRGKIVANLPFRKGIHNIRDRLFGGVGRRGIWGLLVPAKLAHGAEYADVR
jgi:hypothetical protein